MEKKEQDSLTNVKVKLIGENGNAFNILGKVRAALRQAGCPERWSDHI